MFQKLKIILLVFFSLFISQVYAQQTNGTEKNFNGNSPYSRSAFGDIAPTGTLRNIGMGGVGVSSASSEFINNINPALLPNNRVRRYDSLLTILEGSIAGQLRKISNNNSTTGGGSINFNSFAYLFPVTKRWTTSIGLHPFSSVNYNFSAKAAVTGNPTDTANYSYTGSGGIYQADFTNGVKLTKNFNLGLQVSYLFGSIHNESFSQLLPDPVIVGTDLRTRYAGFMFRPGMVFRKQLDRYLHRDSAVFINMGLTYDFFGNITGKESLFIQRRDQNNILLNTVTAESNLKKLTFPPSYRFGVSFDKYAKWNFGADFSYTNWNAYKGTSTGDTLKNSYSIFLGGELSIRNNNSMKKNDLKKKCLRAGITLTKTPLYFRGNQLNDISFSLGYSFTAGRKSMYGMPLPKLNIALVVGQRGTLKDGLIKDQYIKAYLGLTINDKWFSRRRID